MFNSFDWTNLIEKTYGFKGNFIQIGNEKIYYNTNKGKNIINKQELKNKYFFKNGLVYVIDVKKFMKKKLIITKNSYPIITNRLIANIDNYSDLKFANYLLKYEKKN